MEIEAFKGDSWSVRAAKKLLPILVQCAKQKRTIYYSEVKELLFAEGIPYAVTVMYGYPAGIVGDALFELANQKKIKLYPPLNALVVAKKNDLPSSGADWHLTKYLGVTGRAISSSKRAHYVAKVHEDIFAYNKWDNVLNDLKLASAKVSDADQLGDLPNFPNPRHGGGGESPAHRNLKEYVARHPERVGLVAKVYKQGKTERQFACADRVDVFFEHAESPVAVECKACNASNDELTSGIFQCVKYEALLVAENVWKKVMGTPRCVLAVGRALPGPQQRLAKLLGVKYFLITDIN